MKITVLHELAKLAQDLYLEGYHGGISDPEKFYAWAYAMAKVAEGQPYTDDLVDWTGIPPDPVNQD